ncbi:MAG: hypothetical protein QXL01_00830 [Thermoplasmatales archaeon]
MNNLQEILSLIATVLIIAVIFGIMIRIVKDVGPNEVHIPCIFMPQMEDACNSWYEE